MFKSMKVWIIVLSLLLAPILWAEDATPLPDSFWLHPSLPEHFWQDAPQLELLLEFRGGWNPSYWLRINFDTGEVGYTPLNDTEASKRTKLPDFKKVGIRVKAWAAHIPTDHALGHFSEDASVYRVTFRDGESVKHFSIIAGPHEGEPPDAYALCELLDEIVAQSKRAK